MPLRDLDLAIVDVETTGAASHYHRIIEIAVLKVKKGRLVETFSTLVDPERTISPFVEGLTGITNKELENAPTFSQVKDRIYELLDGSVFVAHNARFDYNFVREEFERAKTNYTAKHLCTVRLSRALFPEYRRHSLDSLMERFDIRCANRHRATGDALVLWKFLQILQDRFSGPDLKKALAGMLKAPALPPHIDEALVKSLPSSPGVYIFLDRDGDPLYVGKSINLRTRVLSHFSSDHDSVKEQSLYRQVADIRTIKTSGELGALLLESHLLKQLSPLHNRRTRVSKRFVVMKRDKRGNEYETIRLERLGTLTASDLPDIVGIFKSMKQAKDFLWRVAGEHALCPRILGLEKGKGTCTYTQVQRCNGACKGMKPPPDYNSRFLTAFAGRGVTPWPFPGPVLIEEQEDTGRAGERFVVDKWCLISWFRFDETGTTRRMFQGDYTFDYDGYKILVDYLIKSRKKARLHVLTQEELACLQENF
ncbi:MAG TPA: ethanolamine utilization protein [Syntrophorhabdus aromaticivorans]|nr:ethanolamine utilization protein [Syntrophorhabdus aromaticivorans]